MGNKILLDYLTILRPVNGLMGSVAVYIGSIVAGSSYYGSLTIFLAMISAFLISSAGMIINDYFDIEIDKINKPERPLASGRMKKNIGLSYSILLFIIGISLAYFVNYNALAIAVIVSILLILYAKYMKKMFFIGNFTVSLNVALTFLYGGIAFGSPFNALLLSLLALLSNIGREIYKSSDDILGDKQNNVTSLATKYGVFVARKIGFIFVLAAVIISFIPYMLGIFSTVYLMIVIVADVLFLLTFIIPKKAAKLCKIAMLIALISFIIGTI